MIHLAFALVFFLIDSFRIELDDFVHDRLDFSLGRVDRKDIIVLINAILNLDVLRMYAVLQTEKRIINKELLHMCRNSSGLEVVDSQ